MSHLPTHARVLDAPGLWMEGNAVEQLGRVARLPRCVAAVGLPDLHAGPGIPIGAAFAFTGAVRPLLVGGDAGCGVRLVSLPKIKFSGDALFRRIDEATQGPVLPGVDPAALFAAAWREGPAGLAGVTGVPDRLAELAALEPVASPASLPSGLIAGASGVPEAPVPDCPELGAALGTIGGGNHFVEVGAVGQITNKTAARRLGLTRQGFAILAHSGSRGLGRWLLDRWGDTTLTEASDLLRYLGELQGAVRYARANRFLLAWRLLVATGCARPGRIGHQLDLVHNDVSGVVVGGEPAFLHRKGAAPANRAEPTVVLGSRGTPSHVLLGSGNKGCLCTVAHGAGRRMGRKEAVDKLKGRYRRTQLARAGTGRVLCPDSELLYAEHPDAYKDVEPVIQALESAGAAERVAELHPQVTVKR